MISRGSVLIHTFIDMTRQKYVHAFSKIWLSGRKVTEVSLSLSIVSRSIWISMAASKQEWSRVAPFGSPVVPDVYISVAMSDGFAARRRFSTSARHASEAACPRAMKASNVIVVVSSASGVTELSKVIIWRSEGHLAIALRAMAYCLASQVKMMAARVSLRIYSTCSSELVA